MRFIITRVHHNYTYFNKSIVYKIHFDGTKYALDKLRLTVLVVV